MCTFWENHKSKRDQFYFSQLRSKCHTRSESNPIHHLWQTRYDDSPKIEICRNLSKLLKKCAANTVSEYLDQVQHAHEGHSSEVEEAEKKSSTAQAMAIGERELASGRKALRSANRQPIGANSEFLVKIDFGINLDARFFTLFLSDLLIGAGFVTGETFTPHL